MIDDPRQEDRERDELDHADAWVSIAAEALAKARAAIERARAAGSTRGQP